MSSLNVPTRIINTSFSIYKVEGTLRTEKLYMCRSKYCTAGRRWFCLFWFVFLGFLVSGKLAVVYQITLRISSVDLHMVSLYFLYATWLLTLFVEIFARTNFCALRLSENKIYFCAPSIKVQNSVLIFAQFRANFWLKQLFCIYFFKI